MRILIFSIAILSLVGCIKHQIYMPPTEGPRATIAVPASTSSYKLLGGVSSSSVHFGVKGEDGCGIFFGISSPQQPGEEFSKLPIPANNEIFVRAIYSFGNSSCSPAGSFFAEDGYMYKVIPSIIGRHCGVKVVASKSGESDKTAKLGRVYVDSWTGQKVCSKKSDL